MSAVPTNVSTSFVSAGSNVEVGAGYGGDSGTGFHSNQPIRAERWDDTENTHFKDRLDSAEGDLRADGNVASYPKYPESPYVRYVQRPLSSGVLSPDVKAYKPEDRSKMGVPLNPFWIRNDLWSMENEADIFMVSQVNSTNCRFAPDCSLRRMQVPTGWYRAWVHIQRSLRRSREKRTLRTKNNLKRPTLLQHFTKAICRPLSQLLLDLSPPPSLQTQTPRQIWE